MFKPLRKEHALLKLVNGVLIDLPSPSSISLWWNMGSLLGVCLVLQIVSGLFLSFHYSAYADTSFDSVIHIVHNINLGWILRNIHVNGGTFFFFFLYIHIGRGIYYGSFNSLSVWMMGVVLFILLMATAFLGYVLPWGQMSFWAATVITSMFSALPYIGSETVQWLWGGYSISEVTLTRFYSLHFLLPFVIVAITLVHIMFLHQNGSKNPLGLDSNMDKISFHPYYSSKDFMGFFFWGILLLSLSFFWPMLLSEPDNFYYSNPLVTPPHIQPEWYFLFAYAILRAIPNKLGGVVALLASILILFAVPFMHCSKFLSSSLYPLSQIYFWSFVANFFLLTWIGARPAEEPYIFLGGCFTFYYFLFFFFNPLVQKMSDY